MGASYSCVIIISGVKIQANILLTYRSPGYIPRYAFCFAVLNLDPL